MRILALAWVRWFFLIRKWWNTDYGFLRWPE
jgi:hypothetical protein